MTRDFEAHKNRRKAWDRGFSVKGESYFTFSKRIQTDARRSHQHLRTGNFLKG